MFPTPGESRVSPREWPGGSACRVRASIHNEKRGAGANSLCVRSPLRVCECVLREIVNRIVCCESVHNPKQPEIRRARCIGLGPAKHYYCIKVSFNVNVSQLHTLVKQSIKTPRGSRGARGRHTESVPVNPDVHVFMRYAVLLRCGLSGSGAAGARARRRGVASAERPHERAVWRNTATMKRRWAVVPDQSSSSGYTGFDSGMMLLLSTSRDRAFRMS